MSAMSRVGRAAAFSANVLVVLSGCQVYVDEPPPPRVAPRPRVVAVAPAPAPLPPVQPASTIAPPAPPVRRRVRRRTTALREAPLPPGSPAPSGSASAGDEIEETPTACLDTGTAPTLDCATMAAPDPSCAPFPQARQRCGAYKANFDPKVAAAAVYCMTLLSSKEVCDPAQATACARNALTQACADPSVVQLCKIASGPCKTTPADCSELLSGLNEGGQDAVAQCVAHGCAGGLPACIDALPAGP